MLRYLPQLLLLCCSLSLSAQTLERSFGLELVPLLSERRVAGVGNVTFDQLEIIDSLEAGNPSFGLGVVYESRVDRIGYTTGLRYTRASYGTLQQLGEETGVTYSDEVRAHYLSLPFELVFYQDVSEQDRVLFMLGAAVQYHLGTGVQRTSFRNGEETGSERLADGPDYRGLVTSFITGFGYDRKLSSDWAIRLQPTFEFYLNGNLKPNPDTKANRNFYQIGLRLVVRRLFI